MINARRSVSTAVAGLGLIVVILAGVSIYAFSYPPTQTSTIVSTVMMNPCGSMSSSMGMTTSSSSMMSLIIQNATTTDYKLMLQLVPSENMYLMCQVTNSTMSGEVMISGQMNNTSMGMNGSPYHLELHIYDTKTGATVALPANEVTITITNSSGMMGMSVPIAEMFGIQEGVTDLHQGNNVQLSSGNYTVSVSVAGEKASFALNIPSM
jgi:hypothetical protein